MGSAKEGAHLGASKQLRKKKYLGDPNDPHFVPGSPTISRQELTFDEEEELTRSCTVVLEGIQHSDNNDEDPLMKYISNQLAPKQTRAQVPKDKTVHPRSSMQPRNDMHLRSQRAKRENEDTATPSTASKRDTIDRTDTSTPLTMLSETLRKTSGGRQDGGLRSKSMSPQPRNVCAYLEGSHAGEAQQDVKTASKSTISLPCPTDNPDHEPVRVSESRIGKITVQQVEFNKSLPCIPRGDGQAEKPTNGFSHLLKAATRKPKQAIEIHTHEFNTVSRSQTVPVSPVVKKSRFNLASIFNRKRRQQTPQLTVL